MAGANGGEGKALAAAIREAMRLGRAMADELGIAADFATMARLEEAARFAAALRDSHRRQLACVLRDNGREVVEALGRAAMHVRAYRDCLGRLACSLEPPTAWRRLDGEAIARRWREADEAWLLVKWGRQWKIKSDMRRDGARGKLAPAHDAPILAELRREGREIEALDKILSALNLRDWRSHESDADRIERLGELGERLRDAARKMAGGRDNVAATMRAVEGVIDDDALAPGESVGKLVGEYLVAYDQVAALCGELSKSVGQSVEAFFAADDLAQVAAVLDEVGGVANLRPWCRWAGARERAREMGMESLVAAVEGLEVAPSEVKAAFEVAYCTWWADALVGREPDLREFSARMHADRIDRFRESDAAFSCLTGEHIRATLMARVRAMAEARENASALRILKKEANKQRRHKPIRRLFSDLSGVIRTLSPCLMMSPLSVAQYLPVAHDAFDVVIFDEASQVTVWDAIGALARGRQAVVVGDPKQMPPTNFFARKDDDPDGDFDDEGDLESILDEMNAVDIPKITLNLHYRSRREGLIRFSNRHYYEDKLITFPEPGHGDTGVCLEVPDGYYARGGARHNEGEARAIVTEIVRRLRDDALSKKSIGVVTFNTEQQSLILDLLDKARGENPEIEPFFDDDGGVEPVFVKNLETVQGDERDVIFFSVTYGCDAQGRMAMNFGPLNRQGGERRLNVALTRARFEMRVFSTMKPELIDISRTKARGAADLKHFLEYARSGRMSATTGELGDFESPFEEAVARRLRDKGWVVRAQVGVSAYRIDLGVVHPDKPGVYLAGVECDGAMYHSSASARERDKIRQGVLEGLGWTLFRVWSTDWWEDSERAFEKLHNGLRGLCGGE